MEYIVAKSITRTGAIHLWSHDEKVPSGNVVIAQSVGHVNLTQDELRKGATEKWLPTTDYRLPTTD